MIGSIYKYWLVCGCLLGIHSWVVAQGELEKAKIEIQTLEERLKIKQKEIEAKTEKVKEFGKQIVDLQKQRQTAEFESQKWHDYALSLEKVLQAKEDTLTTLREDLEEKDAIIQDYEAIIHPILVRHSQDSTRTAVSIDSMRIKAKTGYLLFSRSNPPQRLIARLELLKVETHEKITEKKWTLRLSALPEALEQNDGQADTGEAHQAVLFYYEGSKEFPQALPKGKYIYQLYVDKALVKTEQVVVM